MRLKMVENVIREELKQGLAERLKHVDGGYRDLMMMAAKAEKLCAKVMATVPEAQKKSLEHNMHSAQYAIGARMPGKMGRAKSDEWGTWISWKDLTAILDGLHDHCMMCDKDISMQKACPLRESLEAIPNSVPDAYDGGCRYRGNV